uniref:Uncharacterized protein n=1 Tax=Anguilla anguilla TaxID=7936 RepID=A0A0E9Y1I4_ANGAN
MACRTLHMCMNLITISTLCLKMSLFVTHKLYTCNTKVVTLTQNVLKATQNM